MILLTWGMQRRFPANNPVPLLPPLLSFAIQSVGPLSIRYQALSTGWRCGPRRLVFTPLRFQIGCMSYNTFLSAVSAVVLRRRGPMCLWERYKFLYSTLSHLHAVPVGVRHAFYVSALPITPSHLDLYLLASMR